MSASPPPPLTSALMGYGAALVAAVGFVLAWVQGLAPGGMLLGVIAVILGTTALVKKGPRTIAASGLAAGVLAAGIGAVNGDWESVPAAATTVDGRESVGTSRGDAVPLGSKIASEGWTVVVNSVDTVAKDAWGNRPADFGDLLSVNVTAAYDGDTADGEVPALTINHESVGGDTHPSGDWTAEKPFPEREVVEKGGSVTGDMLFTISEMPWRDGHLMVSPSIGGAHVYVRLK